MCIENKTKTKIGDLNESLKKADKLNEEKDLRIIFLEDRVKHLEELIDTLRENLKQYGRG